jgi:acetyl-CoA synthetase
MAENETQDQGCRNTACSIRPPNSPPTQPSPAWMPTASCARSRQRLRRLLGPPGPREHRLAQAVHQTLDESNAPFYKWFADGQLNVSYNCLDRNLRTATPTRPRSSSKPTTAPSRVTYRELHERVCKFANGLKSRGIKKGDRVVIYMSMSIEGVAAMQACARIGATHSVVFGGFSAKSLQERIIDAGAVAVITADEHCAAANRCR